MTKRILSVLLALVLVLAVAAPALAFELKVNDADGRTYEAYQIFTGEYVADNAGAKTFMNAKVGSNLDAAALAADLGVTTPATDATYATALVEALAKKGLDGAATANYLKKFVTGTPITLPADVAVGYYLIVETTANAETHSAFLLDVYTGTTIAPKRSDVPVTDKKIVEGTNKVNVSDNAIGDVITFEISATVPANADKYDPYTFVFHDTLSAGLTYQNDAKVVSGPAADKIEYANGELTVNFDDVSAVAAGTVITVQYTAVLNKDAVVAGAGNLNTFTLEYTNAPGVDEDGKPFTEETPEVYAVVFTFSLTGDKFDEDTQTKLAEAKFVLKNADKTKYLKKIDATTGDIEWTANKAEAQELVSASNGSFGVSGLDAGTYYLEETEAPSGYNKLTSDVEVVITPSYDTTKTPVELTNAATVNPTVQAPNNKGTVLPSTGGIGTTLFYVIGGLLMAFAVVLLVAKKRTVNE